MCATGMRKMMLCREVTYVARKLASIQVINKIESIPDADRIELAHVMGWQAIVKKGDFKEGDAVVFFEIDSLLPEEPAYEFLRKNCYNSVSKGFRIKTAKMRGCLSQGLIMPLSILDSKIGDDFVLETEMDVTQLLGVKKWERQPSYGEGAKLKGHARGSLPSDIPKTDEQRIQSCPQVLQRHEGEEFYVTEKLDGCLQYKVMIKTDQGYIAIGKIVNNKLPVRVASYNEVTGKCEFRDITEYHKYPQRREIYHIGLAHKGKGSRVKFVSCTDNHKFYSRSGDWIQAKDLHVGDEVAHFSSRITPEVKQVLLGTLLGDGTIIRSGALNTIQFSHSVVQNDYFNYVCELLGDLIASKREYRSGYGSVIQRASTKSCLEVSQLIDYITPKGKKTVTREWCNMITPLGLAIWYMDDGSLSNRDEVNQRPRISFATNGFSFDECQLLQEMMSRFGITSKIATKPSYKGNVIQVGSDDTEKFCELIAPFVCKAMKYKLPIKYEKTQCVYENASFDLYDGIVYTKVKEVKTGLLGHTTDNFVYDLSIDDTHNYFANGVLTHNTSMTVFWDQQTGLHVCSRNIDLQPDFEHKYNKTAYWDYAKRCNLEDVVRQLGDTIVLQGELIGPGIQRNHYKLEETRYRVFNMYDLENRRYLEHDVMEDAVRDFGLGSEFLVPKLGYIELENDLQGILALSKGKSVYGDMQREGIVCRGVPEARDVQLGRLSFKAINDDFLLQTGE